MELNQLDYFRTVARLENMTKAAEELYVSQPNLSTSISRLENSLGIQLFQRTRGHIYLTDAGRRFLQHVESVFDELDAAEFEIQEGQEFKMDSVSVASSVFGVIPAVFLRCYQDYGLLPSTRLLISNAEIEQYVQDGTVDMGVMTMRPKLQELECVPLGKSPLVAVMKNTNPIGCDGPVSISHFKDAHYICNTLYFSQELLSDLCVKTGFQPKIVRVSNEQECFDERSFDFGDNVTVCPLHIVPHLMQEGSAELRFVLLGDSHAREELFLVRHGKNCRTAFIPEFFDYVLEVTQEYIAEQNQAGRAILEQRKRAD